jgi:lipopolysaccharide export system protein LptA
MKPSSPLHLLCGVLLSALLAPLAPPALAEKADLNKPANIDADSLIHDDVKQTSTFTGNVVVTRGTLIMKAGKMILKTDPAGNQFATLLPDAGGFTTFRQKRDGGDLWVQGHAERIEYDNKSDIVKLFSKAKLTRLDGGKPTEDMEGEFISYDSRNDLFSVNNTAAGVSKPGAGRVKMVIQPRPESKP